MMEHEEALRILACEKYLLGELSAEERDAFEEHFFTCRDCARDVRIGEAFIANTRAVLQEQASFPAVGRESVFGLLGGLLRRPAFSGAIALLFLIFGFLAYRGLFQVPALRSELAQLSKAQGYSSYVLRPPARDADQVVPISTRKRFISFTMDVDPEDGFSAYEWRLTGESDEVVFSAVLTAPTPPRSSLSLLVPSDKLDADRYQLSIYGRSESASSDSQSEIRRYTLQVEKNGGTR